MVGGKLKDLSAPQRRVIRAWCMYDWANSGYATAGGAAIFPVYFVFLFKDALGESVSVLGITFTGSSTWSLAIAVATALVAVTSPVLGVIADRVAIKKILLWIYTIVGSVATCLMFFSAYTGQPWLWFLAMFMLANVGFAGCLVFYNTFLPHIAPRELLDDVSSRGFAYGYVGGGLLLAVHLALILAMQDTQWADLVTRLAIASTGVWWFAWALWTFKVVPEPHIPNEMRGLRPVRAVRLALTELSHTFHEMRGFRAILVYLVAYLLFNDGIQTVLNVAGAYGADTIGIPLVFNMATILIIQFVAAFGAMAFSWLASRIATKGALMITLVGWSVLVLFGVGIAPLEPHDHGDFDYQLEYQAEPGVYVVGEAPDKEDSALDRTWREELAAAGLITGAETAPASGRYAAGRTGGSIGGEGGGIGQCPVLPVRKRGRAGRNNGDGAAAPLQPGGRANRLVAEHGAPPGVAAAGAGRSVPVAAAGRGRGPGHGRQPGPGAEPVRPDSAPYPQRRVLLLFRFHGAGLHGLRPPAVRRGNGPD